ncbi:hypothetical protein J4Q44_G00145640 [Coregonus suidteri]|uniref:Uncharacterized protein n=1 Tax=Coregonus suidteri TaxID=861788 RepID=A0AAN8QSW1_9TELE
MAENILNGPPGRRTTTQLRQQWRIIGAIKKETRNIRVYQQQTMDRMTLRRRFTILLRDHAITDFHKDPEQDSLSGVSLYPPASPTVGRPLWSSRRTPSSGKVKGHQYLNRPLCRPDQYQPQTCPSAFRVQPHRRIAPFPCPTPPTPTPTPTTPPAPAKADGHILYPLTFYFSLPLPPSTPGFPNWRPAGGFICCPSSPLYCRSSTSTSPSPSISNDPAPCFQHQHTRQSVEEDQTSNLHPERVDHRGVPPLTSGSRAPLCVCLLLRLFFSPRLCRPSHSTSIHPVPDFQHQTTRRGVEEGPKIRPLPAVSRPQRGGSCWGFDSSHPVLTKESLC